MTCIGVENRNVGLERGMVYGILNEFGLAMWLEAIYLPPLDWVDVGQFIGRSPHNRTISLV
ncbi:hypothetical protein RRF57_001491 [Xylaria bambusicola]|uniref:Uncharacterized protein n=1 Tax=Xylaria bambusicola TaxID=326684 RepID=A0AAN7Z661_9PEZI